MENLQTYLQQFLEQFFSMGVYAYIFLAFVVLALVFTILSAIHNKNAKAKWLAEHPQAVKIDLVTGTNLITTKEMRANVVSGEAAIFVEKGRYVVFSMPGDIVLELTYTFTRPGIMYKSVSTTWGPNKIELHIERDTDYALSFDKKEEKFVLAAK